MAKRRSASRLPETKNPRENPNDETSHTAMAAGFALLLLPALQAADAPKVNLLFIMTDQQRWDAMSCAGNLVIKTPHLDQLAKAGRTIHQFLLGVPSLHAGAHSNSHGTQHRIQPRFEQRRRGSDRCSAVSVLRPDSAAQRLSRRIPRQVSQSLSACARLHATRSLAQWQKSTSRLQGGEFRKRGLYDLPRGESAAPPRSAWPVGHPERQLHSDSA